MNDPKQGKISKKKTSKKTSKKTGGKKPGKGEPKPNVDELQRRADETKKEISGNAPKPELPLEAQDPYVPKVHRPFKKLGQFRNYLSGLVKDTFTEQKTEGSRVNPPVNHEPRKKRVLPALRTGALMLGAAALGAGGVLGYKQFENSHLRGANSRLETTIANKQSAYDALLAKHDLVVEEKAGLASKLAIATANANPTFDVERTEYATASSSKDAVDETLSPYISGSDDSSVVDTIVDDWFAQIKKDHEVYLAKQEATEQSKNDAQAAESEAENPLFQNSFEFDPSICTVSGDWQWSDDMKKCDTVSGLDSVIVGPKGLQYSLKHDYGVPVAIAESAENTKRIQDLNLKNGKLDAVVDKNFVDYSKNNAFGGEKGEWKIVNADCEGCEDRLNDLWKANFAYDLELVVPKHLQTLPEANASKDATPCPCPEDEQVVEPAPTPVVTPEYLSLSGNAPAPCLDEFVTAIPQEGLYLTGKGFGTSFSFSGETLDAIDKDADGDVDVLAIGSQKFTIDQAEVGTDLADKFVAGQNALESAYRVASAAHQAQWNFACEEPVAFVESVAPENRVVEARIPERPKPPKPTPTKPRAADIDDCTLTYIDDHSDLNKSTRHALEDIFGDGRVHAVEENGEWLFHVGDAHYHNDDAVASWNGIRGENTTMYVDLDVDGIMDVKITEPVVVEKKRNWKRAFIGKKEKVDETATLENIMERLNNRDWVTLTNNEQHALHNVYAAQVRGIKGSEEYNPNCKEPVVSAVAPQPRYEAPLKISSEAENRVFVRGGSETLNVQSRVQGPDGEEVQDLSTDGSVLGLDYERRTDDSLVNVHITGTRSANTVEHGDLQYDFNQTRGFSVEAEAEKDLVDFGPFRLGVGGYAGVNKRTFEAVPQVGLENDQTWNDWDVGAYGTLRAVFGDPSKGLKGSFAGVMAGLAAEGTTESQRYCTLGGVCATVENSTDVSPMVGARAQITFGDRDQHRIYGVARYFTDFQSSGSSDIPLCEDEKNDAWNAKLGYDWKSRGGWIVGGGARWASNDSCLVIGDDKVFTEVEEPVYFLRAGKEF